MAWRMNALNGALTATSTLYTLSSEEFGGDAEVRIVGTGFTYDAVSGILNGGTITSMSLVANGGTETVQTVTMPGGLAASTYFAFAHVSYDLRAQTSTWALQFPDNDSGFTFTSTLITLVMLDGTKVLIAGSGFDTDTDAGTVTSMVHVSANGLTTLHTATGFPASLAAVSSAFGNDETFYGVLVQGNNVVTQVSTSFFIGTDGGAGNDSLNGGAQSNFGATNLDYHSATAAVIVSLTAGTATGGAGNDTLTGFFGGISGSSFNDTLTGNANSNFLAGQVGNDTLIGLAGNDTLHGGLGNDTLDGGADNDTASYADFSGNNTMTSGVTVNLSIAGAQNTVAHGFDTLISIENLEGSYLADTLTGNASANILTGGSGNDILDGAGGADQMFGGDGDDTYFIDDAGDQVFEFNAIGGVDTVNSNQANSTIGNNIENFNYTGSVALTVVGNTGNNVINAGNATSSFIQGGAGSDVVNGGAGNDDLYGDSQFGDVAGNSGISLGSGNVVHSGAGNGSLATALNVSNGFSLAADPEIEGAAVVPHVSIAATGGGVIDFYSVQINNINSTITADIDHGFGTSNSFNGTPIFTSIKFYDPTGNVVGIGTGADPTSGAAGSLTYTDAYMNMNAFMTGLWKIAVLTYTGNFPGGVESPVANGATYELNISVAGELTTFDDTLHGNGGSDRLVGGIGNDLLDGGSGTDTADYSAALQAVTAIIGGTAVGADIGTDTLVEIENLNGGGGDDSLNGDGQANELIGNGGNDSIFAGGGADLVVGGEGNDTLVGNGGGAGVFAHDVDTLFGGNGTDIVYGESSDIVSGGAGTDFLYSVNAFDWNIDLAATGFEWMFSDFGNDVINAAAQGSSVEIYGVGGNDTITGSAQGDMLWAGVGDDIVSAGGGDDMLFGDFGADSLSAGDGADRIYADSSDILIDGGNGFDAVYISGGTGMSINMATAHIEWIADTVSGNDTINGSALTVDGNVYAGGGADIISGGAGMDFLWGEVGNDGITGGANNDTLVGGTGSDTLTGGTGLDTIYTNSGGGGDGVLDIVIFDAAGWGTDFVYDFDDGIDKLNLNGSGAMIGTVTISNVGGHANVQFGADLIIVVGAGATFDLGDIIF